MNTSRLPTRTIQEILNQKAASEWLNFVSPVTAVNYNPMKQIHDRVIFLSVEYI